MKKVQHLLVTAIFLLFAASPAQAYQYPIGAFSADGVTAISIEVDGRAVESFPPLQEMNSVNRIYRHWNGIRGEEYGIRLVNNGRTKKMFCLAVDGRSTLTGNKIGADVDRKATWGQCYVVPAHESSVIAGYQQDSEKARAFKFSSVGASLANRMWDDISAVGTIVVAVFDDASAPSVGLEIKGAGGSRGMGTAAGRHIQQSVTEVQFTSKPIAEMVYVMHYDSERALRTAGIWKDDDSDAGGAFARFAPKQFIGEMPN